MPPLEDVAMITFDKRFIAASVVIAATAAVVSTFATAGSTVTPNAVVAQRYSSQFAPAADPARQAVDYAALTRQAAAALEELKKKQRTKGTANLLDLNTRPNCRQQTWPNIASECLVTANGVPARQPARYISTDRVKRAAIASL